ncbi:DUF6924 domain-containing protein [Streptomyces galbus]|uniref:DUF6924 domain-containing protein n=1 Tax=Streptomyces galbus TaxID=33898 RepID=UPI00380D4418
MSDDMFAFHLWHRAMGSPQWVPASRLLARLDGGGNVAPTHLSWGAQDGAQWAMGFSPDMTSCYGYHRTAAGEVVDVRGERDVRAEHLETADTAREYVFGTQTEVAGKWQPAGRLTVLIDDGSETPVRWVAWGDQSGAGFSLVLRSPSPSGKADVSDLVCAVRASAEHGEASEVAGNLLAAGTTKWFAPRDRASLTFRLAQPVAVDAYVLTSANDAPDRDPAAWVLSGSADGLSWRTLDFRSGQSFAERHQSRKYRIAEPASCDHYRLDITSSNGSPHLQLQAVGFHADGISGFVGYRRRTGEAPVAYRGDRITDISSDGPTGSLCGEGSRAGVDAPREPDERQSGGPWLPLGGSLSMESLTSPSGRFTVLHSVYGPSLTVRDNTTRKQVWSSGSPRSDLVCLGPDGDLVAWDHRGNRVWHTGTGWLGVRRLEMRDSGELALTGADGTALWTSGVPQVPADAGPCRRTVARGSTMHRGESLQGQSLTSDDGSTVLFHDGRVVRILMRGHAAHWDRSYDEETVLALDDDGFLRSRGPDGTVVEEISGPGTELVVVRGRAELRDDAGAVVWASAGRSMLLTPVHEPAVPHNDDLAAWFGALVGEGRGYCVAVVKGSTPHEVLRRAGVTPGSDVRGTWRQLERYRDAAHPGEGKVVAAIAAGPDVLLVSDDPDLPVAALAPSATVVSLHQPSGGNCFGGTFTIHEKSRIVTELRDDPRRRRGATADEVTSALDDIAHPLHRHELVFRTSGVVPSAAELGGRLLGASLIPAQPPSVPRIRPLEPSLMLDAYEDGNPLVVRTDFTDEDGWDQVVQQLREPWPDDDPVAPHLISDPSYAGATPGGVLQALRAAVSGPGLPDVFFIADSTTMRGTGHPLLAVSTEWSGGPVQEGEEGFAPCFRLLPNAAVEVSSNLHLGNTDFEDLAANGELYERKV